MKRRAIIAAMVIALATPAFADISDYESMHRRIADALGSRAQADAAYDKLMQEANSWRDKTVRTGNEIRSQVTFAKDPWLGAFA